MTKRTITPEHKEKIRAAQAARWEKARAEKEAASKQVDKPEKKSTKKVTKKVAKKATAKATKKTTKKSVAMKVHPNTVTAPTEQQVSMVDVVNAINTLAGRMGEVIQRVENIETGTSATPVQIPTTNATTISQSYIPPVNPLSNVQTMVADPSMDPPPSEDQLRLMEIEGDALVHSDGFEKLQEKTKSSSIQINLGRSVPATQKDLKCAICGRPAPPAVVRSGILGGHASYDSNGIRSQYVCDHCCMSGRANGR